MIGFNTMKNTVAIKLDHISKEYIIHHEKPTLVEKLINGKDERFLALDTINLTIHKGESVGFVGPNGSGKTTLLKILSGICTPTRGRVYTEGKIISLIGLEAGFHSDLTGLQNIYINGMLLGMSKKEIDQKLAAIITYADIGRFIDVPLFTYSSGMMLRLGFAIAIHSEPDILILDEMINVGDANYRRKTKRTLQRLIRQKDITVVASSHTIEKFKYLFQRIIHLEKGKVVSESKEKHVS